MMVSILLVGVIIEFSLAEYQFFSDTSQHFFRSPRLSAYPFTAPERFLENLDDFFSESVNSTDTTETFATTESSPYNSTSISSPTTRRRRPVKTGQYPKYPSQQSHSIYQDAYGYAQYPQTQGSPYQQIPGYSQQNPTYQQAPAHQQASAYHQSQQLAYSTHSAYGQQNAVYPPPQPQSQSYPQQSLYRQEVAAQPSAAYTPQQQIIRNPEPPMYPVGDAAPVPADPNLSFPQPPPLNLNYPDPTQAVPLNLYGPQYQDGGWDGGNGMDMGPNGGDWNGFNNGEGDGSEWGGGDGFGEGQPGFMGQDGKRRWLQVVHPPSPDEKDWVMTAGNESLVDNVLAISLQYGGRLVSMGYYVTKKAISYYAIMHQYDGPVFIKPNPMTFDELVKAARENEARDLALTQACGQEEKASQVTFTTYWEKIPGVEFHIWFPGTPHADEQRKHFENQGFRLTSLCGYVEGGKGKYIGIWQKPTLSKAQYEAHYGLTMQQCMQKDKMLTSRGYVAISIRVFNNEKAVLCTGIWEFRTGRSRVTVGSDLGRMYKQFSRNKGVLPRQISHFTNQYNQIQFVVLWSDVDSFRYPNPPDLWDKDHPIPVRFLKGTPELLSDTQMDFLVRRVEHFMKDLNIPGLSIAIAKREQLKFAAGFGYADVRKQEPVTPNHQFRVGSVSKPITAAAIMMLIDRGKFKLDDKLFGLDSIFGNEFSKKTGYKRYVEEVTVRHLLEHTAGGWDNLQSDAAWIQPEMDTKELIAFVLENVPLEYKPGTMWIYSNFGYQLLGYLIETASNMPYETFVKKFVFAQSGVYDIQVARPSISDKGPREVLYYMSGNGLGFDPYQMLPPERIGPWGGWIASPIQLLMFLSRVDGFRRRPDILSDQSIVDWAIPSSASNDTYGLGWSLNIMGFNGWQHDGRMPGSAAMVVRLDNELEMAIAVNKEYSERDFFSEMGFLLHHLGNNCDWWPDDKDLFQKSKRN